jgi:prepilin-type N-terminal cleavage/methylation domain-containing protein
MKKAIYFFAPRRGFTLVELLIAVAIISAVSVGGFIALFKYRGSREVELTVNELASVVRDTQRKSVTQQGGKRWGIRFENSSAGAGSLKVFSGTSFASGTLTQTIPLRSGVSFGEPFASSTYDLIFAPIEGTIAPNKVVTVYSNSAGGFVGDLLVNSLGKVAAQLETGLVGYWHMDETTSTVAYDASGNGRSGTLSGLTRLSVTNCKAGGCLHSTADSMSVAGANPITGSSPFTMSAWLNMDSHSNYGLAFYMGADAVGQLAWIGWTQSAQVGTSNSIGGGFYGTNFGSGVTDTDGWHHVVFTFEGGEGGAAKLYVDGMERASSNYTPNLSSAGIAFGHPSYPYNGDIDEVRLYNRALSASEVLAEYNALR